MAGWAASRRPSLTPWMSREATSPGGGGGAGARPEAAGSEGLLERLAHVSERPRSPPARPPRAAEASAAGAGPVLLPPVGGWLRRLLLALLAEKRGSQRLTLCRGLLRVEKETSEKMSSWNNAQQYQPVAVAGVSRHLSSRRGETVTSTFFFTPKLESFKAIAPRKHSTCNKCFFFIYPSYLACMCVTEKYFFFFFKTDRELHNNISTNAVMRIKLGETT